MREIPCDEMVLRDSTGELSYRIYGTSGPHILVIDGLLGGPELWHALVSHFSDRYRILMWQGRGLGADDPCALHPVDHARDAKAILNAEGVQRVAVLAYALGVQVALELVRVEPGRVSILALLDGGAHLRSNQTTESWLQSKVMGLMVRGLRKFPEPLLQQGLALLRFPEAYLWARRLGLLGSKADPEVFALLLKRIANRRVALLVETLALAQAHDSSDILARVAVPTLVVAAGQDPLTSRAAVEELVSEIHGAEYLMLSDAGHFALLDHSDHLNLRLEKFFAEHEYR